MNALPDSPALRRGARSRTRRLAAAAAALFMVALFGAQGAALAREETAIIVHFAFGTPRAFAVEGRVAERHNASPSGAGDSWLRNLWRTLRSLRVEERKNVAVRLGFAGETWTAHTDAEGYFAVSAAAPPLARPGWTPLWLETADGARTDAGLLIVPDADTLGIISDFDDTVIVSEVPDRSRLAEHTLLENYLQRQPVAGMAALYHGILARNPFPAAAPVIYLTASPRQLQPAIEAFLERNGFPRGPVIAKKVSDGAGGDPLLDQERYKTARIERIFADLPGVRFVLVGDDGERDPEVYNAIRSRHPERVEAVYIRHASPDPARPTYRGQQAPPVTADAGAR